MSRITTKDFYRHVADLIEDGQLVGNPVQWVGGDVGHGSRFCFVSGDVEHTPRVAIDYLNRNLTRINERITRLYSENIMTATDYRKMNRLS